MALDMVRSLPLELFQPQSVLRAQEEREGSKDDESQVAQVEPLRNPKDQKGRNRLQNLLEKGPARWRWERLMLKNLAMELLGD